MNWLTHQVHLWRIARMMRKANALDEKIDALARRVSRYETEKFPSLRTNISPKP